MGEIISSFFKLFTKKETKKPLETIEIEDIEDDDIFIPEKRVSLSLEESYHKFMQEKNFFNASQQAELMHEQGIKGAEKLLEDALHADIEQLKKEGNTFLIKQRREKLLENSLHADYKRLMGEEKFSDASEVAELMFKYKFKGAEKLLEDALRADIEQLEIGGNSFAVEQKKEKLRKLYGSKIMRR